MKYNPHFSTTHPVKIKIFIIKQKIKFLFPMFYHIDNTSNIYVPFTTTKRLFWKHLGTLTFYMPQSCLSASSAGGKFLGHLENS